MKKITFILVAMFMLFGLNGFSQTSVKWNSIEEAMEKAAKQEKLLFIDCYTSWCGWCKVLDKETFSNDTIARILNYYFYPVKFDAEGSEDITINGTVYHATTNAKGKNVAHELMKVLWEGQKGAGYPSMVIRKADFSPVTVEMGYRTPSDLEPILVYFAEGYNKKMSFSKFEGKYFEEYRKKVLKKIF